ncbi:MAG: biotin-dependent carboxyltransferase family protein [Desulfobacterales bacterium]|nr:biotin-dependent carboxyltransferase family protein [Desulfobacterales bacterium]
MKVVKALEILLPGPLTTVQDLGRYGFGCYGVPPSGAIDSFALRAANLIAGNAGGEACLEITLTGLKARILTDLVLAVTGGHLQPQLNGRPFSMWEGHSAKPGDILSFKGTKSGCRAYLSLGGGISLEPVLGSRSTNISSGFGGPEGRALRKGDILCSESPRLHLGRAGVSLDKDRIPHYGQEWSLRVLPGPQHEDFPRTARGLFMSSSYAVTQQSDRTGIRLSGPPLHRSTGLAESIISEGVVPGAIQVPGDGQPIIILVETITGGYRKIATVISADLPLLGQMKPGDRVKFVEVSREAALEALRSSEEILGSIAQRT